MKKILYILLFFLLVACGNNNIKKAKTETNIKTSDLYVIEEMRDAYKAETRNKNGKPGENYFQNRSDFVINVKLDPETGTIYGSEKITYKNNSPDSLNKIVIKLEADIFKKGNIRDYAVNPNDLHDGMQLKKIIVNGEEITGNPERVKNGNSLMSIIMPGKIAPGYETVIEIDWSFTLNKQSFRMGNYEGNNSFVAYWYPKPAVYDDVIGWAEISYTGITEFYNDFSNYEVNVTVPKDYNIWSTGVLQNPEEIYTSEILERINKSLKTDSVIHVISKEDRKNGKITIPAKNHTYKFTTQNMPVFAFAASKSFLWDATSVQSGERRISVNAVYKQNFIDFDKVAGIAHQTVEYMTNEFPGVAFPYPSITAFNGENAAMENPGMVNDVDVKDFFTTWYITCHEIGHQFFPFYTGINEQRYAWMDEGVITFYSRELVDIALKDQNPAYTEMMINNYAREAGTKKDVPPMIHSNNLREAYRTSTYHRTSVALYVLREIVGKENFRASFKDFIENWKGKHPVPQDFFNTFNRVCKQDLAWFWKPWFFDLGYPDLAISEVKNNTITIEKIGTMPVSVSLKIEYTDEIVEEKYMKPDVWKNGEKNIKIKTDKNKQIKTVTLDTELVPDADKSNNIFENKIKNASK